MEIVLLTALGVGGFASVEEAFLRGALSDFVFYENGDGHTVGWGRGEDIQVYSAYRNLI